jgi:hypothetical protein
MYLMWNNNTVITSQYKLFINFFVPFHIAYPPK